jgi:HAD superfamily hydrolase (TIGR01509 family)
MKQVKAVIFDMDGVIVDSEPRHERAFMEVVRQLGYADKLALRFSEYIGRPDDDLWVDFIAAHKPTQTLAELLALKRELMVEIIRREQPLFRGVSELIGKLAPRYALALASGSEGPVVEAVLQMGGLRRFFSVVVSASDVKRGKPAPDVFLRAAELLNVAASNCWVIEDSKPGIAAGLAAGMRVIAIANTHAAEELAHATRVVRTYSEIERLLLDRGEEGV